MSKLSSAGKSCQSCQQFTKTVKNVNSLWNLLSMIIFKASRFLSSLQSYNPPFPLSRFIHLAGSTISPTDIASTMQYSYIKEGVTFLQLVLDIKWQNGLETGSNYFEPKIRYCSNLCSIFCLCRSPGPHQINQIIRYLIWSILITSMNTTSEYGEYIKNLAKSI